MSTIKCCKDCGKRVPGCHSCCKDYINEKAEYNEMIEQHRNRLLVQRRLDDQLYHSIGRSVRRRGKPWK